MDYWEFAQFLCVIGLPRLTETRSLLSSISVPGNADISVLDNIEQKLLKITSSSKRLTFFENGGLPSELELSHLVADNVATMSHDRPTQDGNTSEAAPNSFTSLIPLLPEQFRAITSSSNCCTKDGDIDQQKTRSKLIFRLFELHAIDTVLDELLPCVLW